MEDIKKRSAADFSPESKSFFVRRRFSDIDDLGKLTRSWDIDFRQISRGLLQGDITQWGSARVQLAWARLRGRVHQMGSTPAGYRTFAIPATRDIRLFWRGHDIGPDQIMVFPRSRELDCASHPDFDMLTISVKEDDLEAAMHRLRLPRFDRCLAGQEVVTCEAERLSRARSWFRWTLETAPGVRPKITPECTAEELVRLVVSSGSVTTLAARPASRDVAVARALRVIATAEQVPCSVEDLARTAGCSARTLRRAFDERFGVGPKTYLLARRLVGVRRELRDSDREIAIIADVANRWGFWHMGQFAADYRLFFGELPSTTLGHRT